MMTMGLQTMSGNPHGSHLEPAMFRRSLTLLCGSLAACGGGSLVTDEEAAKFHDVATDQVPEMSAYGDDVFKNIASNVCTLLKGKDTSAADAVGRK